jgi:hypothetical protein
MNANALTTKSSGVVHPGCLMFSDTMPVPLWEPTDGHGQSIQQD